MAPSPVKVFISHAEHDKATIAIPLYQQLKSSAIQPFVDELDLDVGDNETTALETAMDEADTAVIILSPEYIAYKQPMKELLRFLQRRREALQTGVTAPVIVPCFYRLTKLELLDEPRLDRLDCDGKSLYGSVTKFLERLSNAEPEANTATIKAALRELLKFRGLENDVDATNHNTIAMARKRRILVDQLCENVKRIVPDERVNPPTPSSPTTRRYDVFTPHYEDKVDVSGLAVDFECRDGSTLTRKVNILEMVLDRSRTEFRSIAIRGIAGVGKTSMLKALLNLDQVKSRFKDGIYFMSLGKDVTRRRLVELLASFVRRSGGIRRASMMLEKGKLIQAFEHFRSWFSMKDCLFVVDNIWETKEMSASLIHDILTLCRNGPEDKVLLTTRNRDIASRADACFILEPKEPLEAQARDILSRYSCIPVPAGVGNALLRKAVTEILRKCCGLPLFLAIAGRAVRSLSFLPGSGADRAYQLYASSLDANMESFINTDVDSYKRLYATLIVSIELLEERMSQLGFEVPFTANEMYRRLSVLERQGRVPMIMLQYLWELSSKAQAEIVAREFEQMATVDIEIEETADGDYRQFLCLHDSLHLFATKVARNETRKAHEALLMGYGADLEITQGYRMWWCVRLKPDGYIHENLCRHLLGSARYGEIVHLLFNPEWIARMFSVSGIAQIERDFISSIAALESKRKQSTRAAASFEAGTRNRDGFTVERSTIMAMVLLSGAVSAAAKYILANFKEFPFQLYARLVGYSAKFNEIRAFLDLIEKNKKDPWVKSISCVLQHPSQVCKRVLSIDVSAFCMVAMGDGERIACGCHDGRIIIVNVAKSVTESSWKAHNNIVGSLATGRNGTILVSASLDFRVNVWDATRHHRLHTFSYLDMFHSTTLWRVNCLAVLKDDRHILAPLDYESCLVLSIETGDVVSRPFVGSEPPVQCMALLEDGKHMVTGQRNGSLRCWEVMSQSGRALGKFFEGHHQGCVESLILSPDGTKVISGSIDGTARIWDLKDHMQLGEPFVEPRKAWVRRIAMSSDGRKLAATCGVTRQVIRIWDVETRREICRPMSDHESEITGISFLPGDNLLVTCSKDATIRVWDITVANDDIDDEKHSNIVSRVCFTPDGSHAVSASYDGTLRVWNSSSGLQIGEEIEARSAVVDVAVERNGSTIVSLSENMTVRTWDMQTRTLTREIEKFSSVFPISGDEGDTDPVSGERNELVVGASSRSRIDEMSVHRPTTSFEEFEPISSVAQESTKDNAGHTVGESLPTTQEALQASESSLREVRISDEHSSATSRSSQSRDTAGSITARARAGLSQLSDYFRVRAPPRLEPTTSFGSRFVRNNGIMRMRDTQIGSSPVSRKIERSMSAQAYLSTDGRRVIYAEKDIRVRDLSTGELRLVRNTADRTRAGVMAAAGEETTSMPDILFVPQGNRHIRLANGEVLATFEAPVRHCAWAGTGNVFCVGLENGRVGIMKLMNADDGGCG